MLITDFRIRTKNAASCVLSWTSGSEEMISWIFVNGTHAVGPFMPGTRERSVTIPFPEGTTAVMEIHDFPAVDIVPDSCTVTPQTRPLLSWCTVEEAERYQVYYGTGTEPLREIPNRPGLPRQEIRCPVTLDGRHGQWHSFHVEAADRYNNESADTNERITFWAYDLPPVPELTVQKNPNGLYDFTMTP
jgi:hypothetical protein